MTLVKICGITNLEDAIVALDAGADLLGFVFYPKSPRCVSVEIAAEIVQGIQRWRVEHQPPLATLQSPKLVGLFVNESLENIQQILAQTPLDYAQLHGDESPVLLKQLGTHAFRAIRPTSHEDALQQAEQFHQPTDFTDASGDTTLPRLLIDAYDVNAYGGTGKKADWHAAAVVASRYPQTLLAGGLTPDNVADAIATVRPWGVDVSSGVEAVPGKKDHQKVRDFLQKAKAAL